MTASATTTGTEIGAIATGTGTVIEIDRLDTTETTMIAGIDGTNIPAEAAATKRINETDATNTIDTIEKITIVVAIARISETMTEIVTIDDRRRATARGKPAKINSKEDRDRGANLRSRIPCHPLKQHLRSLFRQQVYPLDLFPL